jgi:hypothetical protein
MDADNNATGAQVCMQNRKPRLPPSRAVLVILPLSLIEALDKAADALQMSRSDVIRRSLVRDATTSLNEEVARAREAERQPWRPKYWSV